MNLWEIQDDLWSEGVHSEHARMAEIKIKQQDQSKQNHKDKQIFPYHANNLVWLELGVVPGILWVENA